MLNNEQLLMDTMRRYGKGIATSLQERSATMTSTEIVAEEEYLPRFVKAVEKKNMLTRPIGFAVITTLGNVCKLVQPYDSTIYTQEPEELPAQWGFQWSTDPAKAKPFIALSTSPYSIGECCIGSDSVVYRSTIDNNTFDPVASPQYWAVATAETSGDTLI